MTSGHLAESDYATGDVSQRSDFSANGYGHDMQGDRRPYERAGCERHRFSLMLGGPLYRIYLRTRLVTDSLQFLRRRVFVLCSLAWLPLLALSLLDGRLWGGVKVPFLLDVEVHSRLLIALPLLLLAEVVAHRRINEAVPLFVERGIVSDAMLEKFDFNLASAKRLRDSVIVEGLLLAFVYSAGVATTWSQMEALDASTWYRPLENGSITLTPAGWWYVMVSLPLFQFLLFRWYFRLIVWARFLWQTSRISLHLVPTHPDAVAGLGFLNELSYSFAPLLLTHGVLLAGVIAGNIFFAGMTLLQYKVELIVIPLTVLAVVLGPFLAFTPKLWEAKRIGSREYGTFAQRYVRHFDAKWLRGKSNADNGLLGTADIQSLADLGNSFDLVERMRIVLIDRKMLLVLTLITLLPIAPLLLTMISIDELLKRILKVLF